MKKQPRSQVIFWLLTIAVFEGVEWMQSWPLPLVDATLIHFIRIFLDSLAHALIAGIIWVASLPMSAQYQCDDSLWAIGLAIEEALKRIFLEKQSFLFSCICGSIIDIDHFIEANSWTLHGATHLSRRPFAHSVIFAVVLPISIYLAHRLIWTSTTHHSSIYWGLFSWNVLISHQLRDALRRGLWLWPLGSTKPLSKLFLAVIYLLMIHIQYYCLSILQYRNPRGDIVESKKIDCDVENQSIQN